MVVLAVTTTVLLIVVVYSTSFPSEAVDVETVISGLLLVNGYIDTPVSPEGCSDELVTEALSKGSGSKLAVALDEIYGSLKDAV